MSRKAEFTIGLIGGILGVIASIGALFMDEVWNFNVYPYYMYSNHIALFLLSLLGIAGSTMVRTHSRWAGMLMLIAGIVGFVLSSILYFIPAVLLIIAGGISLYRGYKYNSTTYGPDRPIY